MNTALVHRACPICGKKDDSQSEVIIQTKVIGKQNSKKAEEAAKEFAKLHNQIIGYGKPCEECQKLVDLGGLIIIEVDAEKTEDEKNPYTTGRVVATKGELEQKLREDGVGEKAKACYMPMEPFEAIFGAELRKRHSEQLELEEKREHAEDVAEEINTKDTIAEAENED